MIILAKGVLPALNLIAIGTTSGSRADPGKFEVSPTLLRKVMHSLRVISRA